METGNEIINEIKHNGELCGFYWFVGIIGFTILVIQPVAMLGAMVLNALSQM
jgi:hypothetical protein